MVKIFTTKSKIHDKLKNTVGFTGKTQENQAELSQSLRGFIFRISVEHMGNYHQVYMAPSWNFTQNNYLNPELLFSSRVEFVQICCSWEQSCCCDMENNFLSLYRAECQRTGFDTSFLQANRRAAMASLGWEQWAAHSEPWTGSLLELFCVWSSSSLSQRRLQSRMEWPALVAFPWSCPPSFMAAQSEEHENILYWGGLNMGQREWSHIPGVCGKELHGWIPELGIPAYWNQTLLLNPPRVRPLIFYGPFLS